MKINKMDITNLRADFKSLSCLCRAINNKYCLQILRTLNEFGEANVTEIYVKLRLEQPIASKHLVNLKKCNLVISRKDGRRTYYLINKNAFDIVNKLIETSKELNISTTKK